MSQAVVRSSVQKLGFSCQFLMVYLPLSAVGVLFSPMVSGWVGGRAVRGKKFVRAVSQKL